MGEGDEREIAGRPGAVRSDVRSWPTGRLLSVAARVLERRFDEVLAGYGLSHAGLIALHHLTDAPLAQRPLAGLCRVTEQTMSRTVDRLARAGYVSRRSDEADRRRLVVEITPGGREVLEAVRRAERESESLLGALDDYEHFREQVIALIVALEGDDPE
ncbi:MarR family winged helix-turn-helix transcriptional regulator [Pseudonocardia nigra]|uniref:MarR family winged helix-turn-helix transcriptional regulator n=1 Tax=Pseudonocardia nigra TaxID=1921578 RepID=UPI0027E2309A|nr:MarR family transcriptional regulator [Pseudonocardia nigra]